MSDRAATAWFGTVVLMAALVWAEPPAQDVERLPPAVRLGVRVENVRRQRLVVPTVVVVPDPASYIEAVAGWGPRAYYPVLIDDGTPEAAEDIARFVRGFDPEHVVNWSSGLAPATSDMIRRERVESALTRAWAMPEEGDGPDSLIAWFGQMGLVPPGVVVADAGDPAWPAALALAAGRGQPIVWVRIRGGNVQSPTRGGGFQPPEQTAKPVIWTRVRRGVNAAMPMGDAEALARAIEAGCRQTGLTWQGLGDDLDAVTICMNCPIKVRGGGEKAFLAMTDVIGRTIAGGSDAQPRRLEATAPEDGSRRQDATAPGDAPRRQDAAAPDKGSTAPGTGFGGRWAWAGQVFGNEAQSAYRSMCALFLEPERAWLFDGYPDDEPWSKWDATEAGRVLEGAGLEVDLHDRSNDGERAWRVASTHPVDAGLVMVNSKGNRNFFDLKQGRGRCGDVPVLARPAMVYFVHSWSANRPADRKTVAGRWIERGAYAYLGSVHEPYLQAFVPTPAVARRLLAPAPWGAATRIDTGPPWKIAVIGDPLITLGPKAPRQKIVLPIDGAADLRDALKSALDAGDFTSAVRTLTMLGRDDDTARLVRTLLKEKSETVTDELAALAIMPVFRAEGPARQRTDTLIQLYNLLTPEQAEDGVLRDALWHACWLELSIGERADLADLLRNQMRPDQIVRDALDVAGAMRRLYGRDAALAMLRGVRDGLPAGKDRDDLEKAMTRGWR
jgi:hypothetical protein